MNPSLEALSVLDAADCAEIQQIEARIASLGTLVESPPSSTAASEGLFAAIRRFASGSAKRAEVDKAAAAALEAEQLEQAAAHSAEHVSAIQAELSATLLDIAKRRHDRMLQRQQIVATVVRGLLEAAGHEQKLRIIALTDATAVVAAYATILGDASFQFTPPMWQTPVLSRLEAFQGTVGQQAATIAPDQFTEVNTIRVDGNAIERQLRDQLAGQGLV